MDTPMLGDPVHQAVCAALEYLREVVRERAQPDEALQRLRVVGSGHLDVPMQLLWEQEAYDSSLHYDVILRPKDGETVSIGVCQDALPWPLRGVQRWTEANLLQVNGRMLTMEEAVVFLDILWNESPLMERMIDACLIREELERDPIMLSDDELQSGLDALRRTHQLYTVEDTEYWMQRRGVTQAQLERLVTGALSCAHLRKRVAADRAASFFSSHRNQLDVAYVARIELSDYDSASRLLIRLNEGPANFVSAMQQAFVSGDGQVRCTFTSLRRHDISSELEERLFAAAPGEFLGPIRMGSSHVLGCLLELRPACYDAATEAVIERILFDVWLAERRRKAKVTWHWGRAPDPE